jgi:Uma2 family endonuclease
MATVTTPETPPPYETVADLRKHLGNLPLERIRLQPPPGTATEEDMLACRNRIGRLCELVDGILVEKPVGYYESPLAIVLAGFLEAFLSEHDLGIVLGGDGPVRVQPRRVRMPDVSIFGWHHFPNRVLPPGAILNLVPDLAVEVLSRSNTREEMRRKRQEYFAGGARLVWEVDPEARTVRVYTSPNRSRLLREGQTADGGDVLPGFTLPIRRWFTRAGQRQERR